MSSHIEENQNAVAGNAANAVNNEVDYSTLTSARVEVVPPFFTDVKHTFRLFWPIFLGQLFSTSLGVVDTVMAGAAGTVELSGVAIGASFYLPAVLFLIGMTLAIQPTVAHLRGAGKSHEIASKLHLSTVTILIASVIVGVIVSLLPLIYNFLPNIDRDMVRVAQGYLWAIALGMPACGMFSILRGYWEGLGNTLPTLVFGFVALMINIPLNYVFIFGKLGMPALGGIGCGVATTITMYITVTIMLVYIQKAKFYERFRIYRQWFKLDGAEVKKFLKFSLPLAFSTTIEVTCFSLVALLLSPFGPQVVSAHAVAINVSGLLFMVPLSIGSSITIRVGEAMGAMHWNRARRSVMGAFALGIFFYLICMVGIILFHKQIIELYSSDPAVIPLAVVLLIFGIVYLLPDTVQVIAIGVLRGFKDSKTIFVITIISYWVVGMPVGYILGYGIIGEPMAAQGFWIGFICALSTACVLYLTRIAFIFKRHIIPSSLHETMEHAPSAH